MTPDETIALRLDDAASDKAGSAEHTVTDRSICIASFRHGLHESPARDESVSANLNYCSQARTIYQGGS
jgi:hypothetical protein